MANSLIESYFQTKDPATIPPGFLAYLANLECVARVAPEVARSIVQELADQRSNIKLIASENYSSLATQCAMGNLLTDKYAEGIPHHRFYAGCDNIDSIEDLANQRARNSSARPMRMPSRTAARMPTSSRSGPSCGPGSSSARSPSSWAAESPDSLAAGDWYKLTPEQWGTVRQALGNQRLLGLDLASGGHLTHGYRLNSSGKMFESHGYTVDRETYLLDYDAIEQPGNGGQAADPPGRFQRLFPQYQLRPDARDRRQGRRGIDGRHGPLRRPGGREGAQGRIQPDRRTPTSRRRRRTRPCAGRAAVSC